MPSPVLRPAARRLADAAEDYRRARLVVATIAELHLRTGNIAAAEQALAEITGDPPSSSDYEQLTLARVLIARGAPDRAVDVLGPIEDRARAEGRDGSLVAILAVTALARHALGEPAAEPLAHAVGIAAPDGYRRTFLDEGAAIVPLLKEVRSTAPDFVTDLLARFCSVPVADKLYVTVGTTKWHLNQIFGRLQARNRTEAVARAREFGLL